jgi:threonine synthase
MKEKFHYVCINCGAEYRPDCIMYLCPSCEKENKPGKPPKGVLSVVYDYGEIRTSARGHDLFNSLKDEKFLPLLPLESTGSLPKLKIGDTPLYKFERPGDLTLNFDLFLKDDSQNPTFSFKDRASALVSAFAKEQGLDTIIAASTGNAGSSLAGICAAQGQTARIFVPASAPTAKLTQILMYGATLIPVKGTYDDAFDMSIRATEMFGFYNRNTAFNPMTIEGKKIVSYELYDQLERQIPDYVFVPTGDGVILSGVYKGFEDLLKLKLIGKMPKVIAVQAEGSSNLVRNLDRQEFSFIPSKTIADSISVDVPRNFYMSAKYIKDYLGDCITVDDMEILRCSKILSGSTGLFTEPSAAAAFAGMLKLNREGKIPGGSKIVVLLTGSGLKDPASVQSVIDVPEPFDPGPESLKKIFN